MIENILSEISRMTPFWLYIVLFFFSYIENIFPPSPSDLVVLVGGSLVATGTIHFVPTLIFTTVGSVLGFMTLYFVGSQFDKKVLHAGKIKFISIEGLEKVESWFVTYGFGIILANRFMPGTRSVISFFAGISELNIKRTVILAAISAFAWNTIVLYLGVIFGDNIEVVDKYLSTYSNIGLIITGLVILFFVIRYFILKKKAQN
ncbi:MAG TPA: DedA family protein [Ignavibacteriaceae bacterium]|nr:DedA family protein [Ignavibacteriaceae bacterium]